MTARENMLRAYRHEMPEYVPNGFKDFDIMDSFGERYFGEGSGDDWFGVNWTFTPELHSQTETPEYVPNGFKDFDIMDSFGERYFGEGSGDDWFGVNWTFTPELHSQTETPGQEVIEDLEDWRDKIKLPDLDAYDWEAIAKEATAHWDRENRVSLCMLLNGPFERTMSLMGFENALCAFYETPDELHELLAAHWDRENRVSLCMLLNGPFERTMSLMGFENALCAFYETPDELHELLEAITEHKCRYISILKKYFQFDVIAFHDDWGNNQNMFFSMDMWREFIKPCIQKVIDQTHKEGMIFEMHSCGYIKPTIPELVEMGIDSIQPLQYCNEVDEIKERFGDKILLSGGFNTQEIIERPGASEEEIRAEVRRTLDHLAAGGGYCALMPIIDDRAREIVIHEIDTYGKNFYK